MVLTIDFDDFFGMSSFGFFMDLETILKGKFYRLFITFVGNHFESTFIFAT